METTRGLWGHSSAPGTGVQGTRRSGAQDGGGVGLWVQVTLAETHVQRPRGPGRSAGEGRGRGQPGCLEPAPLPQRGCLGGGWAGRQEAVRAPRTRVRGLHLIGWAVRQSAGAWRAQVASALTHPCPPGAPLPEPSGGNLARGAHSLAGIPQLLLGVPPGASAGARRPGRTAGDILKLLPRDQESPEKQTGASSSTTGYFGPGMASRGHTVLRARGSLCARQTSAQRPGPQPGPTRWPGSRWPGSGPPPPRLRHAG